MTDDELLQIQAEWLHGEEQSGEQSLTNEQAAREQPHKLLAMERGYEEFGNASQWSLFNDNLRHRG